MRDVFETDAFTVIVHSGKCSIIQSALAALSHDLVDGLRPFASVRIEGGPDKWVDPIAEFVVNGHAISTRLIDYLAREMGQLKTINLVAVVATESDNETFEMIDRGVGRLREVIGEMASATCHDYRMAFPAYGAPIAREPFFTQRADANLIAIPRDSSAHDAIAKPLSVEQHEAYASHVGVELATAVGLWQEIDESIIDDLQRINPGTADVIVRYLSSRASYLVCPPLPIDRLMSEEGELPLPYGFHPVPDPRQAVEMLARLIYPPELNFNSSNPPVGPEYSVSGKKLKWRYASEFLKATLQVPGALFKGVQDHLEGLSGAALQEAVGSSESSIEVVYPGRYVNEENISPAISHEAVQKIIDDVSERVDRPVLTTIGEGLWVDIVDKVIAVADGGKIGEQARRAFADERYLLVAQQALGPMSDTLIDLLGEIHVEPRRSQPTAVALEGIETGEIVEELSIDNTSDESEESDLDAIDADLTSGQQLMFAPGSSDNEDPAEPNNDIGNLSNAFAFKSDGAQGTTESGLSVIDENHPEVSAAELVHVEEAVNPTLLREVGQLLANQQETARSRAEQMVQLLLEMPSGFRPRDARTISTTVRVAVALGVSLVYFTLGSLTERRHLVNFESIGSSTRDLLWAVLSTVILGAAVFGLFLKSISKSQGRVIISVTALVLVVGAEFVFWKPIRDFLLGIELVRTSALVGSLLMLGTLAVVALSITRNRMSDVPLRRLFATTLGAVTWIYVLVGVTAVMGADNSAFRDLSSTTENRLVLVLLVVSVTLILVSSMVVAYTIVQERYRLNEAQRQLQWATTELAESADAERRLRLAGVQWIGTAAVLARLFKFPLGSDFSQITPDSRPVDQTSHVLKYEQRPLVLTKRGEQGLSARLTQLFIGQGWLGRQYRQLISRFQDDFAFSRGLLPSEVRSERPEGCSALPTLEDVFDGRARGSRWSFMRSVFAGEYDSALLDTTSEVQLEEAYSTIVVDPEAHSVGSTNQTASSYFARLIPGKPIPIPRGLVSVLFSGSDERRFMTPYLWWPEELLQRPEGDLGALQYRAAPVLTPNKITDPIKLFGACVLVSHPFRLADVSEGAGGGDDSDIPATEPKWGGGEI